jgi:leucyl aminopeptidase
MDIRLSSRALTDIHVDVVVIATHNDWKSEAVVQLDRRLGGKLLRVIREQAFSGAEGETALFQTQGVLPARYVLLVGLGAAATIQPWYRLADITVTHARNLRANSAALAVPTGLLTPRTAEAVMEGLYLSGYVFERLKSATDQHAPRLQQVALLAVDTEAGLRGALTRARAIAAATCYARDLINLPAAIVTPSYLAAEAKRLAREQQLSARILDARAIQRAGMGALLGVAQGSAQPPYFIELVYQQRAATRGKGGKRIALAGKGITFDSGGLSIKPAEAMQTQKRDMAGGAAVLAAMSVLRDLGVTAEVRAYVPATENMPGGRAIKPGDVVRAYNGKSIEVLNTDAEGRLVLADALSFAAAAKPDLLIDLATLTAAVRTALGNRYAAIMGTDGALVQALIAAGRECGENLWELPLVPEYRCDIDSTVADIKNIGDGGAGTIIGGLFLREFAGGLPWAHIDFSSIAVTDKPFVCHPRGATGFGVRTVLRYLRSL